MQAARPCGPASPNSVLTAVGRAERLLCFHVKGSGKATSPAAPGAVQGHTAKNWQRLGTNSTPFSQRCSELLRN